MAPSRGSASRGNDAEPAGIGPGSLKPVENASAELGGWQVIAIFVPVGNSPDQHGARGRLFPTAPISEGLAK